MLLMCSVGPNLVTLASHPLFLLEKGALFFIVTFNELFSIDAEERARRTKFGTEYLAAERENILLAL